MKIEELENTFPNGFHDSYLVGMTVDFPSATALIELDIDCSDSDDPNIKTDVPDKRIKLRLTGLSLFIVDPPDVRIPLSYEDTIWMSGCKTSEKILPGLASYRKNVPAGSFFYTFFLNHWNCFVHFAAMNVEAEPV